MHHPVPPTEIITSILGKCRSITSLRSYQNPWKWNSDSFLVFLGGGEYPPWSFVSNNFAKTVWCAVLLPPPYLQSQRKIPSYASKSPLLQDLRRGKRFSFWFAFQKIIETFTLLLANSVHSPVTNASCATVRTAHVCGQGHSQSALCLCKIADVFRCSSLLNSRSWA